MLTLQLQTNKVSNLTFTMESKMELVLLSKNKKRLQSSFSNIVNYLCKGTALWGGELIMYYGTPEEILIPITREFATRPAWNPFAVPHADFKFLSQIICKEDFLHLHKELKSTSSLPRILKSISR